MGESETPLSTPEGPLGVILDRFTDYDHIVWEMLKSKFSAILLMNLIQLCLLSIDTISEQPLDANSYEIFPVPENKSNTVNPVISNLFEIIIQNSKPRRF